MKPKNKIFLLLIATMSLSACASNMQKSDKHTCTVLPNAADNPNFRTFSLPPVQRMED